MLVPSFDVYVLCLLDGPSSSDGKSQCTESRGPVPALQHRPRRGPNCRCVVAIRRIDWTGIFPQAPSHTFASLKPKPHGLMVRCRPLITLHNPDTTGPASRYRKHVKEGGCDLCALDFFTLNSPTYPGTRSRLGSFKEQLARELLRFLLHVSVASPSPRPAPPDSRFQIPLCDRARRSPVTAASPTSGPALLHIHPRLPGPLRSGVLIYIHPPAPIFPTPQPPTPRFLRSIPDRKAACAGARPRCTSNRPANSHNRLLNAPYHGHTMSSPRTMPSPCRMCPMIVTLIPLSERRGEVGLHTHHRQYPCHGRPPNRLAQDYSRRSGRCRRSRPQQSKGWSTHPPPPPFTPFDPFPLTTPHPQTAIKALIEARFDAINSESPPPSAEVKAEPSPMPYTNGRSTSGDGDGDNGADGEIKVSLPTPKKRQKRESSSEDADARLAAELQAQENRRAGRPQTRGAGTAAKPKAKPKKAKAPKKKSEKRVRSDDDSDVDADGEPNEKKRKAGGGFQKPFNLSNSLQMLLGEPQVSPHFRLRQPHILTLL